jgi:hypothetical protein
MKLPISPSPPLISVANDDDDDDGTNDVEEVGSLVSMIGRSVGWHASAQHKNGQSWTWIGFGLGMGNETGEDMDECVDSAPRSARPPLPRVHLRPASRSASSVQSTVSCKANAGGSRMNIQRLLEHGDALLAHHRAQKPGHPRRRRQLLHLYLQLWDSGIRLSCVGKRVRRALGTASF